MNINDGIQEGGMMPDGKKNPEELSRHMYLSFVGINIILNLLYLFMYLLLNRGPFDLISGFFHYPTSFPSVNIFFFSLVGFLFLTIRQLKNGTREKKKESFITIGLLANSLLFIGLVTIATKQYFGTIEIGLGFVGIILLIFSTVGFVYSFMIIWKDLVKIYEFYTKEEKEEEEKEEEIPYNKYDWLNIFYDPDNNFDVEEDIEKYSLPQLSKILSYLTKELNSYLLLEKNKLSSKEVVESQKYIDYIVQVEAPPEFASEDDVYDAIDEEKLKFSNKYVIINNSYFALKLNTKYLNNAKRLEDYGENILPTQVKDTLGEIPFRPIKKASEEELAEMTKDGGVKYQLFDGVTISKMDDNYYVVFKYTKWYKKFVVFPNLSSLPDILDEETEGFGSQEFNPKLLIAHASEGGYIGLTLSKMRHLLFGGQSGSGKSVFLNSLIYQILYLTDPKQVQLMLVDPLKVSFGPFKKIKHLIYPVAMEVREVINAIKYLIEEQDKRYTFLETLGYEDIYEYNEDVKNGVIKMLDKYGLSTKFSLGQNSKYEKVDKEELKILQEKIDNNLGVDNVYKIGKEISQIVLIYDEFAKFIDNNIYKKEKTMETLISISAEGRKAGIILILGTQTINADTVPSPLRNNIPTRIALKVMSSQASRTIVGDEAENKSLGSSLSGNGDLLVYNGECFKMNLALRGQGFYVSKDDVDNLLRETFDEYGINNFVYKESEEDNYLWIKDYYNTELKNQKIIDEKTIKRNILKTKEIRFLLAPNFLFLISEFNKFLKSYRHELLDKGDLIDEEKNISIDTLFYKSIEEEKEKFKSLDFSNRYLKITKNYIDFKINTEYLNSIDKLLNLEEKIELKLEKVKQNVVFKPLIDVDKNGDDYQKMLKEGYKEYQLITSFEIIKNKNDFYIRANFSPYYKKFVIFPQTVTILNQLEKKYGNKIQNMVDGNVYVLGEGIL